jgi:hypothetical protein
MIQQKPKRTGRRPAKEPVSTMDTLHDTVTIMKPFVVLSIKALQVIASALVLIIKNIPKLEEHQAATPKGNKVIKI